mgnify:CR=1 FL=1
MPLRQRQEIQEVLRHERAGMRGICLAVLFGDEKYEKEKLLYDSSLSEFFSRANNVRPYKIKSECSQQKKQKIHTLSRQRANSTHARPSFFSGRADNACTNLLGFFV